MAVDVAADPPPQPEMKNALVRHARTESLALSGCIFAAIVFIFRSKSPTHAHTAGGFCFAKGRLF